MAAATIPTMTKPRPNPQLQREGSPAPARRTNGRPSVAIRVVVSVILIWHISAVFLAPLSVPPSSNLVASVAQGRFMQPYLDALYLNHGYAFFAPNPGAGKLIRWEVLNSQGAVVKQGEFPSRKEQWPRLWYHRHFMLADQLGVNLDGEREDRWKRTFLEAYARHILRRSDGDAVRIRWIVHQLLDPDPVLRGVKLDDPSTYRQLVPDIIVRRSDLGPEDAGQSSMWQGERQNIARPQHAGSPWTGVTR